MTPEENSLPRPRRKSRLILWQIFSLQNCYLDWSTRSSIVTIFSYCKTSFLCYSLTWLTYNSNLDGCFVWCIYSIARTFTTSCPGICQPLSEKLNSAVVLKGNICRDCCQFKSSWSMLMQLSSVSPTSMVSWFLIAVAWSYCIICVKFYFQEHFMEVTQNQEFLKLPADEVAKLLASDDLNVPSEEEIFHVS